MLSYQALCLAGDQVGVLAGIDCSAPPDPLRMNVSEDA